MKYFILSFIFYFSFVFTISGQNTIRLRILTFNIYHGETMNHNFDLDKIAQIINSVQPDLVALQEVDLRTNRAKKMDLLTELALRTDLNPLFGRAMYYDDGEYGEGILSKFSFVKTKRYLLPYSENHEPRAVLEALIELSAGDTIRFLATHFDHTEIPPDRIKQAKKINELFRINDYPTILAGDLNAVPESESITILKSVWIDACNDKSTKTFSSAKPNRRIDYIMYKPEKDWKLIEYKVICDKIVSDHCAVFSIVELKN